MSILWPFLLTWPPSLARNTAHKDHEVSTSTHPRTIKDDNPDAETRGLH